jgi:hypothetical protein
VDPFKRIAGAVKALAARLRRSPAMTGPPPSARKPVPIAENPEDHAVQFARDWADRLEHFVEGRMHELDVPETSMGYADRSRNIPWAVFFPNDTTGGNVVGQRISIDSGVLNPDLLAKPYGPDASKVWAKSRLRDRIDATIAHELAEAAGGSHEEALRNAADTSLPIREEARRILRAMADAEKKR